MNKQHHRTKVSPPNKISFDLVKNTIDSFGLKLLTTESEYKSTTIKMKLKCNCGDIFYRSFYKLKSSKHKTCEPCAKKEAGKTKTNNITDIRMKAKKLGVTLLSNRWLGHDKKLKWKCAECDYSFEAFWSEINQLKRKTCKDCGIEIRAQKKRLTYEDIKKRFEKDGTTLVTPKKEFNRNLKTLELNCGNCGKDFQRPITRDKNRTGLCNRCTNGKQTSSYEDELYELLKEHGLNIIRNTRDIIPPKEIDIFLPDHNFGIEIHGLHWHKDDFGENKNKHLEKTLMAEKENIQLIQIFENEWLAHKSQIVNSILHKINKVQNKIGARSCLIEDISTNDARDFMEMNHVHGYKGGVIKKGLVKDGVLCALAILGKPRYDKKYDYELIRYATRSGYVIQGGLSRLLSKIDGSIVSYVDRRFGNGEAYRQAGFVFEDFTPPSYWYFKNKQLFHRSSFMKHKLKNLLEVFDENKTEIENMIANDFHRIFDCGNLKFVLNKT